MNYNLRSIFYKVECNLNINKTKFMAFTNKKIYLSCIEVTLDNTKILKSEEERFGVIMDAN